MTLGRAKTTLAKRSAAAVMLALLLGLGLVASCKNESRPMHEAAERSPGRQPEPAIRPELQTEPGGDLIWRIGRPYICYRAKGPMTIDKEDHPEQWEHALVISDFFIPITHEPPKSRTLVRMLWDDRYLYIHGISYDADLRGTLTGQTARLWTEDAVELFLKPAWNSSAGAAGKGGYYEFEISPTNVLLDLEIPIGRRTTFEQRAAWESGARTAVGIKGTIEKPEDTDEYYRVVIAIPWKSMKFGGRKPPEVGDTWKFILARCDLSKRYGGGQELSTCIPLPKVDFHMHEIYPTMKFSE